MRSGGILIEEGEGAAGKQDAPNKFSAQSTASKFRSFILFVFKAIEAKKRVK